VNHPEIVVTGCRCTPHAQARHTTSARGLGIIPAFTWARNYPAAALPADLTAGLAVAVLLIPQALAYATLAGMPPVTGLYTSIAALVAYAAFGGSPILGVGPVVTTALLVAAALGSMAGPDDPARIVLGPLLAVLVGVLLWLMRVLRLAAVVNFLSGSVLAGFVAAAAITVAAAQLKALLGLRTGGVSLADVLRDLVPRLSEVQLLTTGVGGASLAALLLGRRYLPLVPTPLLVMLCGMSLNNWLGLQDLGVQTVGPVPAGMPVPTLPTFDAGSALALLPYAAAIALVSFMEMTAQVRAVTLRSRVVVEPGRELVALGAANALSSVFGGFSPGASYSRTALHLQAGGRTQLAGLVAGLVVLVAVQTVASLLSALPRAVLAAVVMAAVVPLIDVSSIRRIWRIRHEDGLAAIVTFVTTLALGIGPGLATGVLFSLAAFVYRSANPRVVELGRVEGTTLYRDAARFSVRTDPSVLLLRVDGPLYFANAKFLADRLAALLAERPAVKHVLLDGSGMPDVDADGARTLGDLDRQVRAAGAILHLVTLRGPVRDVLVRADLFEGVVREARYWTTLDAALAALDPSAESPLRAPADGESQPARLF